MALGVTIPARHARGRVVRLGPVLDAILATHAYPPVIETPAGRGAGADRAARLAAQGRRRAADAAGADRERRRRAAGVRLSRRRAARLCPPRSPSGWPRRGPNPIAVRAVRQGLSGDHLRPAGDRRALPGDRPARRREPGRGGAKLFHPVRADPDASSASRRARATTAGSRAGCCSSILPRARRGASGCTPGSTIPNGRMSRCSPGSVKDEELTRPRAAARRAGLAAVPRGRGSARRCRRSALTRGCRCNPDYVALGDRPLPGRGARGDGRRRRLDPGRLRLLRDRLPDRAGRSRRAAIQLDFVHHKLVNDAPWSRCVSSPAWGPASRWPRSAGGGEPAVGDRAVPGLWEVSKSATGEPRGPHLPRRPGDA